MANNNIEYCEACEDLRDLDPNLVVNGFSNSNCNNLKKNKGLTGKNDDCEDLNTLNDCLIGSMADEAEISDVCDWREFMQVFVPNVWTVAKGIICAICGLWDQIEDLWEYAKSYRLVKEGNNIVLRAKDGDHGSVPMEDTKYDLTINDHTITLVGSDGSRDSVTVPDKDTWQKNTASQNGYVTKGGDDPHAVWATGADGTPTWRHNPTLSGSLTLYDHDGQIGETKFWPKSGSSSADTIANNTNYKKDTGIVLTAGKWICCATIGYEWNETGDRAIGLTFGNGSHHEGVFVKASKNNKTLLAKTYIRVVDEGSTEKVYLCGRQNSGQTLNISNNPDTYVYCIRIC